MIGFIKVFLVLISLYHILHTLLVYHFGLPGFMVSSFKEGIRLIFFLSVFLHSSADTKKKYVRNTQRIRIIFAGMVGVGLIVSYFNHVSISDMIIGFKYGFYPLLLLLTTIFLGMLIKEEKEITQFFRFFFFLLMAIIIAGVLWQQAKTLFPVFFSWRGYGPVGDFLPGQQPPLYYRTGPGGVERLSGIFSGPNNYGYFFVTTGYFLVLYILNAVRDKILKRGFLLLSGISLILTLSRGAWIGLGMQKVLVLLRSKKHHRWVRGVGIFGVLVVIVLSYIKPGSTIEHWVRLGEGMHYVRQNMWGYGLGSSGPSAFFNGFIVPENMYLQIFIDVGLLGGLLWFAFWIALFRLGKKTLSHYDRQNTLVQFFLRLHLGLLGLMIEGLFLHVFEDSMVNYLFFIPYGLALGYLMKRESMTNVTINQSYNE